MNKPEQTTQPTRLIRRAALLERVPYSDRWILDLEKRGEFPQRRILGKRCVAWVEAEVEAWLQARPAGRLPPPVLARQS